MKDRRKAVQTHSITMTESVTFCDANDSYRPKAIPDVGLVLLDEFIGMQKRLLAIKQEIWSLSKENIGHHWEVQLQSLLDEGKLLLNNDRFNFEVDLILQKHCAFVPKVSLLN